MSAAPLEPATPFEPATPLEPVAGATGHVRLPPTLYLAALFDPHAAARRTVNQ